MIHKRIGNVAGFTLIELVLVTVLLVILGAMAVPVLSKSFFSHQTDAFVKSIESMIYFAEERALYEKQDMVFMYNKEDDLFAVAPFKDDIESIHPAEYESVTSVPTDTELIFMGNEAAVFFPDGTSESIRFRIIAPDEKQVIVKKDEHFGSTEISYEGR